MYSLIFAATAVALKPTTQVEDIHPVYFHKAEVEKITSLVYSKFIRELPSRKLTT